MAELLRVEPGLFRPETEAWFIYDDGRRYLRPIAAQETGPKGPMIISDHIDACISHADGKTYDSKSALFRSYRPEGNPQGVRYECVGNETAKPFKRPAPQHRERMEAINRAASEMGI
jgi:hypothetical protein